LLAASAHGQWAVLSDFEGLTPGDLGAQGGWTTTGPASSYQVAVDPADAANQALLVTGFASDNNAYIPLGTGITEGSISTLFFRMRNGSPIPGGSTGDLVFGSSDVAAPAGFGDYEGYMRMTAGNIDVRDGGGFAAGGPYTPDEWTNIWLVLDNGADTTTLYSSVGAAPASLLASGGFRNGTTDSLVTANVRNARNQDGIIGYIDDVYFAKGTLLTNPVVIPEPGAIGLALLATAVWRTARRRRS
jgi:hypothetical protein